MGMCQCGFRAKVLEALEKLVQNQQSSNTKVNHLMTQIDDFITKMTDDMTAQTTVVASLKPFIQGLFDQIKGTLNLTPDQLAKLASMQTAVEANNAEIAAAMVAPAPPPAV